MIHRVSVFLINGPIWLLRLAVKLRWPRKDSFYRTELRSILYKKTK